METTETKTETRTEWTWKALGYEHSRRLSFSVMRRIGGDALNPIFDSSIAPDLTMHKRVDIEIREFRINPNDVIASIERRRKEIGAQAQPNKAAFDVLHAEAEKAGRAYKDAMYAALALGTDDARSAMTRYELERRVLARRVELYPMTPELLWALGDLDIAHSDAYAGSLWFGLDVEVRDIYAYPLIRSALVRGMIERAIRDEERRP